MIRYFSDDLNFYQLGVYSELIGTAFINRGQAKYNLGRLVEALEDFQGVNMKDFTARKFNNIGLCYYQLGLYKYSEREFTKAERCGIFHELGRHNIIQATK